MLVGITGKICSGKGEAAQLLVDMGFEHYRYSDVLKDLMRKKKMKITRESLQDFGAQLKAEKGLGYLSEVLLTKISSTKAVVDGIRLPEEVAVLKKRKDFVLISLEAPVDLRYKRIVNRNLVQDPKSLAEFKRLDERESNGLTTGQRLNDTIALADHVIRNTGSLDDLKVQLKNVLHLG